MLPVTRLAASRRARLALLTRSPGHILAAGGLRHPALLIASDVATRTARRLVDLGWAKKAQSGYAYALDATLDAAEALEHRLGFPTSPLWRRARWNWRRRALLGALVPSALVALLGAPLLLALWGLAALAGFAAGVYAMLVVCAGPPTRVLEAIGDHPNADELVWVLALSGALRPLPAASAMPAWCVLDPQLRRLVEDRLATLDPTEQALATALAPQLPGSVAELLDSVRVLAG